MLEKIKEKNPKTSLREISIEIKDKVVTQDSFKVFKNYITIMKFSPFLLQRTHTFQKNLLWRDLKFLNYLCL